MRRISTLGLAPLFALAACGDDGGTSPIDAAPGPDAMMLANPGFPVPTAVTKANMQAGGVWTEIGDADWTCLNTPTRDRVAELVLGTLGDLPGAPLDVAALLVVRQQVAMGWKGYCPDGQAAIESTAIALAGDSAVARWRTPAARWRSTRTPR